MKDAKGVERAFWIMARENKKLVDSVNKEKIAELVECILDTRKIILRDKNIFVAGAGRSGLVAKTFAMRLMQLDFDVFVAGETITPAIKKGDVFIVCSGSGETETMCQLTRRAKKEGAFIVCVTGRSSSALSSLSDLVLEVPTSGGPDTQPRQPGAEEFSVTLFEQELFVLLEVVIFVLMDKTNKSVWDLQKKHSNLE